VSRPLTRYVAFFGLLVGALALAATARGEIVSGGDVRVSFNASISPKKLPRSHSAPIALHVAATLAPVEGRRPEALRQVTVEVNRHAVATTRGLPRCPWHKLQSLSSRQALKVCGDSLIGTGHFSSHIDIPEQAPFPAEGRMLAFNSIHHGRPAVAAHVFGIDPAPISEVLPMTFARRGQGNFGPVVTVQMPKIGNEWGYVTGFELTLKRTWRYRGREMSVISASCPAPAGLDEVPFKAARGVFELADGSSLTRVVGGTCKAIS
jgi:hypothetical protein